MVFWFEVWVVGFGMLVSFSSSSSSSSSVAERRSWWKNEPRLLMARRPRGREAEKWVEGWERR